MSPDAQYRLVGTSVAGSPAILPACRRPKRVCLCPSLPEALITLHGKLVILQHPFETRSAYRLTRHNALLAIQDGQNPQHTDEG